VFQKACQITLSEAGMSDRRLFAPQGAWGCLLSKDDLARIDGEFDGAPETLEGTDMAIAQVTVTREAAPDMQASAPAAE
jgi:hypothetical protein